MAEHSGLPDGPAAGAPAEAAGAPAEAEAAAPAAEASSSSPPPPPPAAAAAAALPEGWTAHVDDASGATYYWNAGSGATSWEVPTAPAAAPAEGENPSHAGFLAKRKREATPSSSYVDAILGGGGAPAAKATGSTTWVKHVDPASGQPFFYDTVSQETSWEPPPGGFVDASLGARPAAADAPPGTDGGDAYAATATFNKATGRFEFADGKSYWDSVSRPHDRDGRMMSHYFDLSTLEANRKEAEEMKKKRKKYDWRKYKEMKKKEKTKRRVQQLLMD